MTGTWVLIMIMIGMETGGLATAEFDGWAACTKAGETFIGMDQNSVAFLDYRCVKK